MMTPTKTAVTKYDYTKVSAMLPKTATTHFYLVVMCFNARLHWVYQYIFHSVFPQGTISWILQAKRGGWRLKSGIHQPIIKSSDSLLTELISVLRVAWGGGSLGQLSPFRCFPNFFHYNQNTGYLSDITAIFDRCHRSWAVETPDKYECDWKYVPLLLLNQYFP